MRWHVYLDMVAVPHARWTLAAMEAMCWLLPVLWALSTTQLHHRAVGFELPLLAASGWLAALTVRAIRSTETAARANGRSAYTVRVHGLTALMPALMLTTMMLPVLALGAVTAATARAQRLLNRRR